MNEVSTTVAQLCSSIQRGRQIKIERNGQLIVEGDNVYTRLYKYTPGCLFVTYWDYTDDFEWVTHDKAIGRKTKGKVIESVRYWDDGSFEVYDGWGAKIDAPRRNDETEVRVDK